MILLTELSFALFSFLPTRISTGSVQERYKNKYNGLELPFYPEPVPHKKIEYTNKDI